MKLIPNLLNLPRSYKHLIAIMVDIIGWVLAAILAVELRYGWNVISFDDYALAIIFLPIVAIPIFITLGFYRIVIRYTDQGIWMLVLKSVSLVVLAWSALIYLMSIEYPYSAILIVWLFALFYFYGTRTMARWILTEKEGGRNPRRQKSVVVFGAGNSGKQLLSALKKITWIKVVGFIDDDPTLQNQEIYSVRVYSRNHLEDLIKNFNVSEVFIAIPSLSLQQRKKIIEWLESYSIKVSTLPRLDEIVSGKISFSDIREVNIEDLLGRDPILPKPELLARCIKDKVVMVTGAGGSIGSELCRKILNQSPRVLILYELSEFALYTIEQELNSPDKLSQTRLIALLGSVLDKEKLHYIFQSYKVDTVYHAAAYKHVPIVEHNISEGVRNNTFGTHICAQVAAECRVKNFVFISTDKAVRPTNVMGASKRMAEMALQALQNEYQETRFVMVRFGNVLGSSGSVIPLFRKQIAQGGPVTVTHKEITRFFMTIPEAVSLVLQAGSMGKGGDVFVLDMGKPVKIDTLARKVIKLSGCKVKNEQGEGDIEIQYTGLRPGEKLYEELLIGDHVEHTEHPRIMKAEEYSLPYHELIKYFNLIDQALQDFDYDRVIRLIKEIVKEFNHESKTVDYLDRKYLLNLNMGSQIDLP